MADGSLHGPKAAAAMLLAAVVVALGGCVGPTTEHKQVDDATLEREARKQREIAVEEYYRDLKRLLDVGYPILVGSAKACGDKARPRFGARLISQSGFGDKDEEKWRAAAKSVLGVGEKAQILHLAKGSPAARAGLKPGDVLLSIDDWQVPEGKDAIEQVSARLRETVESGARLVHWVVRRGGEAFSIPVTPEPACAYGLALQRSEKLNAFADGERIVVTQRMMEFARSDDELAVVVGHELAHNYMGHIEAKKQNAMVGGFAGLLVDILFAAAGANTNGEFTEHGMKLGARAFSPEFEAEADYAGAYAAARAGFDSSVAPNFWRRMASRNTKAIDYTTSHPTTAYRSAALEDIIAEIRDKKVKGLPLVPNPKKASAAPKSDFPGEDRSD